MESEAAETAVQGVTFTDALGTEVQIESWDTAVSYTHLISDTVCIPPFLINVST